MEMTKGKIIVFGDYEQRFGITKKGSRSQRQFSSRYGLK
jgi:formylmethanofuran dehydrogenase subunit C